MENLDPSLPFYFTSECNIPNCQCMAKHTSTWCLQSLEVCPCFKMDADNCSLARKQRTPTCFYTCYKTWHQFVFIAAMCGKKSKPSVDLCSGEREKTHTISSKRVKVTQVYVQANRDRFHSGALQAYVRVLFSRSSC